MNNLKQIKETKFRPGTKVKFKKTGLAPTEKEGQTFTVKCNHDEEVFLFNRDGLEPDGGQICQEHNTSWVANKENLKIIK